MAATALKENEMKEFFDTEEKVKTVVEQLAKLIKQSKHVVVYTGAGLSTPAGIPDFRGPNGVWTLEAQGKEVDFLENFKLPTFSHMAIKKLIDEDLVKFIVSQNVDGLHLKSGIPIEKIAELHGNLNKEYCKTCHKVYYRGFDTCEDTDDHITSRKCIECNVRLYDTIIDFGECLSEDELARAQENSIKCDLAIVLGSSLRVPPAAKLPVLKKKEGKLVICNLQKTPLDNKADLLVHTKIDYLMNLLMSRLGLEVPDVIFNFNFEIVCDKIAKSFQIENASVNMNSLLKAFYIIDLHGKSYKFSRKGKACCSKFSSSLGLQMRVEFNLINPFISFILLKSLENLNNRSLVTVCLNASKNSISYNVE